MEGQDPGDEGVADGIGTERGGPSISKGADQPAFSLQCTEYHLRNGAAGRRGKDGGRGPAVGGYDAVHAAREPPPADPHEQGDRLPEELYRPAGTADGSVGDHPY